MKWEVVEFQFQKFQVRMTSELSKKLENWKVDSANTLETLVIRKCGLCMLRCRHEEKKGTGGVGGKAKVTECRDGGNLILETFIRQSSVYNPHIPYATSWSSRCHECRRPQPTASPPHHTIHSVPTIQTAISYVLSVSRPIFPPRNDPFRLVRLDWLRLHSMPIQYICSRRRKLSEEIHCNGRRWNGRMGWHRRKLWCWFGSVEATDTRKALVVWHMSYVF